ncbi:hypothetical protein BX616_006529 [Lobosporangium transversale]|nr:hypothetical protein BX616_006529 [Lobosporangium transversale]
MSMPPPMSSIKPEPQVKQESISQLSSISHSSSYQSPSFYHSSSHHQYGQQPQQQQHSYSSLSQHQYPISSSSSSAGSVASFSNMSPTSNYGLPRHITNLNMSYSGSAVSPASNSFGGIHTGASSAPGSGAATPAMSNAHLTTNGLTSTPSSPNLSNLQYHPSNTNNSGGNSNPYMHSTYPQSPYQTPQQQQQPHSYQHQSSHANDLNSSGYYGSSSPTYGSHPQQQQSGQGQQPHHNSGSSGSSNGSNSTSGSHIQFNPSTAPSPMRQHQQQQYTPLVPPLSETQYAQYHQLLGSSAFSSAQSTPYHSNHSTPYSSMPGSPTRDYQPLNDTQVVPKPKRRQVKNACGR